MVPDARCGFRREKVAPGSFEEFQHCLSSNDGELARSITTCAPATASLTPSPVMVLTPLLGEAATTSWPPWRRMATVFEPIRPVPPMTTIFMVYPPLSMTVGSLTPSGSKWCCCPEAEINDRRKHSQFVFSGCSNRHFGGMARRVRRSAGRTALQAGTVSFAISNLYTRAVLQPAILACSSSGTPASISARILRDWGNVDLLCG